MMPDNEHSHCTEHAERIAGLEERMKTSAESISNLEHFLFGNGRDGFTKALDDRLKRIEGLMLLILGILIGLGIITIQNISGLDSIVAKG